ncbi:helix-turn-helix transcriptional regulator [Nonomuraea basaltis]|uniref:helix-turn-helix transcriptional regulator n=1 Tax=Nonomuraea basaltis TaxID=2495887 RepID=UPI0014865054|nr:LuxR family transcriptional regulator [Nonomuraea basaltis]
MASRPDPSTEFSSVGVLYGRDAETSWIEGLLSEAREGRSGGLVVLGEAGIGKTALLEHAERAAADMRVIRIAGIESESDLPFAGIDLLLRGCRDRLVTLPDAQAAVLRNALDGATTDLHVDRFHIGIAVLSMLAELAEDRALLCVIDDAQWIDRTSLDAMAFAARRLGAEGVGMVFAVREESGTAPVALAGLPVLHLTGLEAEAAATLLDTGFPGLASDARAWVLAESQGNPLALTVLPSTLTRGQQAGERMPSPYGSAGATAATNVERGFRRTIDGLPEPTRKILQIVAAAGNCELSLVLDAARGLGAGVPDLAPAERAGLISTTTQAVTFRHPLVRSATYETATVDRRLSIHAALAEALARTDDTARYAWHLANATVGPDESVASTLEQSADKARERGDFAASAAAYEEAARHSADRAEKGRRYAEAAFAVADAGDLNHAMGVAEAAAELLDDPLTLARLTWLRATATYALGRPNPVSREFLAAIEPVAASSPRTAAFMSADVLSIAIEFENLPSVADAVAEILSRSPKDADPIVTGIEGLAHVYAGRATKGVPPLRAMVETMRAGEHPHSLRARAAVTGWEPAIGDFPAELELALTLEDECRTQGAIGLLPRVLTYLGRAQFYCGRFRDAHATCREGLRLATETAQDNYRAQHTAILTQLAAAEGDGEACRDYAAQVLGYGSTVAEGWVLSALGLLNLGRARYDDALARLGQLNAGTRRHLRTATYSVPNLIEAAVRMDRGNEVRDAAARYAEWAEVTGQPWARATALRCRALLASDDAVDDLYAEAVRLHQAGGVPLERGRTHLLYGEWLRRTRQKNRAQEHLRTASTLLSTIGARPWAERAQAELRATGGQGVILEHAESRLAELTAQELQVATLAAQGLTNRQVGARLFLSHRTIGYHLYKIFPKLGISTRTELAALIQKDRDDRSTD